MLFLNLIKRNFGFKKPPVLFKNWKVVRGDKVVVNTGKDKGKVGSILKVYRKSNMVLVENVNQKLKAVKGGLDGESKGSYETIIRPIHLSNVNLQDPSTGKGTRVRIGYLEDGEKVRISVRSGAIIKKPVHENLIYSNRIKNRVDTIYDTSPTNVLEVTYKGEDFEKIKEDFDKHIQEKERIESLLVFKNDE